MMVAANGVTRAQQGVPEWAGISRIGEPGRPYRVPLLSEPLLTGSVSSVPCEYLADPEEVGWAARCALAALYLPGSPRGIEPPRRAWAAVLGHVRSEGAALGRVSRMLRRKGLPTEALTLETPGLLRWAEREVGKGRILTSACPAYPPKWRRVLRDAAPPAFWMRGAIPPGPFLALVGSRSIDMATRRFAEEVGKEIVRAGYSLVSGAASGCDRAGALGAAREFASLKRDGLDPSGKAMPLIEILPCGLSRRPERFLGCALSPFAPHEGFSGPNAMQRNALIYAMADAAVVVHARFGEGGTWRGVVEAKRRRLCPVLVREDGSRAARALASLGAGLMDSPQGLRTALAGIEGSQAQPAMEL